MERLKVSESAVHDILATNAKKRMNEKQKKADRDDFNKSAIKHGQKPLPEPFDEKVPKQALKDLIKIRRPKRIHEKIPEPDRGTKLEDVISEKRGQTFIYSEKTQQKSVDGSKLTNSVEGKLLNEDSLTE